MKERMPAKVHPRRVSSTFLLSGLAHCGHCGKALTARYAKSGKFAYYVCGTLDKKGAGSCPAKNHNTKKFEGAIIEQIKKRVLTKENLKELVNLTNQALDSEMESHHNELDTISRTMDDTNRRLERLYDAIETGKIDLADLAIRIKELRQRQEQLHTQRIEIENRVSDRRVELVYLETMTEYIADMQAGTSRRNTR
ncbi:recombinase zinc beta ribbon domain-containing protein [Chloroflexota bacterium]